MKLFESRRLVSKNPTLDDVSAALKRVRSCHGDVDLFDGRKRLSFYHDGALWWLDVLGVPREFGLMVDDRQAELALKHFFAGRLPTSKNLGHLPLGGGEAAIHYLRGPH